MEGPVFNTQLTDLKDDDEEELIEERAITWRIQFITGQTHTLDTRFQKYHQTATLPLHWNWFKKPRRLFLVCGAGISVSAGIPDFRSEGRGHTPCSIHFYRASGAKKLSPFSVDWRTGKLEALQRLDEPESLLIWNSLCMTRIRFIPFYLQLDSVLPFLCVVPSDPESPCNRLAPKFVAFLHPKHWYARISRGLAQVCYCHGSFEGISCISVVGLMTLNTFGSCWKCTLNAKIFMSRFRCFRFVNTALMKVIQIPIMRRMIHYRCLNRILSSLEKVYLPTFSPHSINPAGLRFVNCNGFFNESFTGRLDPWSDSTECPANFDK